MCVLSCKALLSSRRLASSPCFQNLEGRRITIHLFICRPLELQCIELGLTCVLYEMCSKLCVLYEMCSKLCVLYEMCSKL